MPPRTDIPSAAPLLPSERAVAEYGFFKKLCALPFVEAVYLFGSRARGEADVYSDIDLAIDAPRAAAYEWDKVVGILDNAPILNKIDYVRYDRLAEGLYKEQIKKYGKRLYAKNG